MEQENATQNFFIAVGSMLGSNESPALQTNSEMWLADDGESSGHTSYESEDYTREILEEADAADIQRIQTGQWDDLSTVPQEGSDASRSNESELELNVLADMAGIPEGDETSETRVPEGDENDALSSHPSSAEENNNEKPACEANRCRCPRGCHCAGDEDCSYCERCYWTWCNCDCKGCRTHDLAGEAEAAEPKFARASGDSDGTPPTLDAPARGNARASSGRSNDGAA